MEAKDRVILSLDTLSIQRARNIVEQTTDHVGMFKIGLSMLLREGIDIVEPLRKPIFLDLKLAHDPSTVAELFGAMSSKVRYATLHPFCGHSTLTAAIKLAKPGTDVLICSPMTVLLDSDFAVLKQSSESVSKTTLKVIRSALELGAAGVVAHPREIKWLREELGPKVVLVSTDATSFSSVDFSSPKSAITRGANFIMTGALITSSSDAHMTSKVFMDQVREGLQQLGQVSVATTKLSPDAIRKVSPTATQAGERPADDTRWSADEDADYITG